VLIRRKDGRTFAMIPEKVVSSPLDVPTIKANVSSRRAKLYNIRESNIEKIVSNSRLVHGTNEIIEHINGVEHPVKIIVALEGDVATVISSYPLKKGLLK